MTRPLSLSLVLALGLAAASAAGASEPAASGTTAANAEQAKSDKDEDRACLRHTGSHLVSHGRRGKAGRDCAIASGRVYTREDLDRTGSVDLADALRRLDPAIR